MRKIIILILLFIIFCCKSDIVFADDTTCKYDNGLTLVYKDGTVNYDYEELKNTWYSYSILWDAGVDQFYTGEEIEFKEREELESQLSQKLCPTVYLCEKTNWGIELPSLWNLYATVGHTFYDLLGLLTGGWLDFGEEAFGDNYWSLFHLSSKDLYIMGPTTYKDKYKDQQGGVITNFMSDGYIAGDDWCKPGEGKWWGETLDVVCGTVSGLGNGLWDLITSNDELLVGYEEFHCSEFEGNFNLVCSVATANLTLLDKYIEDYKNCVPDDNKCKLQKKILINQKAQVLGEQCNSILSNFDYVGEEKECIDACLSVGDKLKEINDTVDGECGFSGKLIQFIANIVKWGKYLIPVIVIVLGILDFIKAISADKDDEMKKAQGRFVKRLIAAALIFIIPFIIEFVLDKMGFASNGCGIIDL